MKYYRNTTTQRIVDEKSFKLIHDFFGDDCIQSDMEYGTIEEMKTPPNVIECIQHGSFGMAIQRSMDIDGTEYETAREKVRMITNNMKNYKRRQKKHAK